MAQEAPTPKGNRPVIFLTVALVISLMALGLLAWYSVGSCLDSNGNMKRGLRVEQLRGTIVHLDEVLTMSARLAAATEDLKWKDRYLKFEPKLDAAIKEAIRLAPKVHSGKAAAMYGCSQFRTGFHGETRLRAHPPGSCNTG